MARSLVLHFINTTTFAARENRSTGKAKPNTKSQTPSSGEIPESKNQKPSSKHQRNPKFQAPSRPCFELGAWSLELGIWVLELSHRDGLREKTVVASGRVPAYY